MANSRRRCATVMEKALKMMKAPTSTAMPPKDSSAGVRKEPMAVAHLLGLVGRGLRARLDVGITGQGRADARGQGLSRGPGNGLHVDLRDAALHVEPGLSVLQRRLEDERTAQ